MAFYQKYRPKNLQEIVGQDFVRQTLKMALQKNQVAHAYLFFGSRGTGKTSTARILAKALNCLHPTETGDPCNTCAHCLAADSGSFVDIIEIDGASNRKIEHARALIEKINFAPTLGKRKVYIIDEVHMLTKEAFNALLKTIEEPPEHAIFLLATTELNKVPETIRSRCQTFTFHRFTPDQIAGRLQEIADHEGITVENREALLYIAKKASGGLRDAIGIFEQISSSGILSLEHLQQELGIISETLVAEFLDTVAMGEAGKAIDFVSDIASQGLSLDSFLEQVLGLLREKMIAAAIGKEEKESLEHILFLIDIFEMARRNMRDASIPTLPLEIAIVKTTQNMSSDVSKKSSWHLFGKKPEVVSKIDSSKNTHEENKDTNSTPKDSFLGKKEKKKGVKEEKTEEKFPVSSAAELTSETLKKHWPSLVQSLTDSLLRGALGQAQVGLDAEKNITISFPADSWKTQVEETKRFMLLEQAVQEIFGPRTHILLTVQSVILEPIGVPNTAQDTQEEPIRDPKVVSEILGIS